MTTTVRKKRLMEELTRLKQELARREAANRPMTHSVRIAYKKSIESCERQISRL
jgi:hypothetical protein